MLLNFLSRKILNKNNKLRNIYKDQTCYLFGNGYSIKFLDLKKFQNLNVLSCGFNYLHKDYNKLNIVADFHLHPGIFSPVWKHPYTKRISFKNNTRKFLIKTNRIPEEHYFFTSIYNYPFVKKKKNIFFLHNFGKNFDMNKIDPSAEFSLMLGSLYAMIGVGVFMGFKNFIFVGMDYLSSKPRYGHFYEFGVRKNVIDNKTYVNKIQSLTNHFTKENNCNFYCLSLNENYSEIYENINYESKFNTKQNYQENFQIVEPKILESLSKIEFEYLIY